MDEVIMKFRKKVIFHGVIPWKHEFFSIKICKLNDTTGYTYGKRVCQRKDSDTYNPDESYQKVGRHQDILFCCSCILDDMLEK